MIAGRTIRAQRGMDRPLRGLRQPRLPKRETAPGERVLGYVSSHLKASLSSTAKCAIMLINGDHVSHCRRQVHEEARKVCPTQLARRARSKLFLIDDAESVQDLRVPPGNRLEALKGDRRGQYSVRINDQFRICFRWTDSGARDAEIVDYHY